MARTTPTPHASNDLRRRWIQRYLLSWSRTLRWVRLSKQFLAHRVT
jgi:hypothetical protein